MSDQSAETSDGNAVEECPAPPLYYSLFSTVKIDPPILPDIVNVTAWSSGHQYNGAISAQITNQEIANVPNECYKVEMQRSVENLSSKQLSMKQLLMEHLSIKQLSIKHLSLKQ